MNIIILLLFLSLLAFILRILPVFLLPDTGFIHIIRGDAEYNLRQIEVMTNNFLQYDWFDPMTAYPYGKNIGWGPLFPMIAGAFAIICGASGQADIINIASFVPPLMAAATIPVVYFIAKSIDGKNLTGIIAAAAASVISLFFLNYTSYGYVDHHAGEILFSALFCLFYILASGRNPAEKFILSIENKEFKKTLCYSAIAGLIYTACYFTSPTTVLFLVIISVYTFISGILSHNSGVIPLKTGFVNTVAMIIPAVLIFIFGVKYSGYALSSYTAVHVIIPLLIIAAAWFMVLVSYGLNRTQFKANKFAYPAVILLAGIFLLFISAAIIPDIFANLFSGANLVFGFDNVAIAEMQP
ncbi:MAG: STT3 domain-containing protein, partial [Methanomicrobium sp.]|nr:STT3 domain-containing protein [Methanomicrobium sp.]